MERIEHPDDIHPEILLEPNDIALCSMEDFNFGGVGEGGVELVYAGAEGGDEEVYDEVAACAGGELH